jgi:hypothetical protein
MMCVTNMTAATGVDWDDGRGLIQPPRSFSALRLLKTYLRSTMGEQRLSSLALLFIHKEMDIDLEKVIDRFALANRRLEFS